LNFPLEKNRPMNKSTLDEFKKRDICRILACGGTRLMAAQYAGCSVRTIHNTAKRDPLFAEQLAKTELSPEFAFLKNIIDAVKEEKNWRAATWALERMYPERYARRRPETIPVGHLRDVVDYLVEKAMEKTPENQNRKALRATLKKLAHKSLTQSAVKKTNDAR
jgi:hypothetical protein